MDSVWSLVTLAFVTVTVLVSVAILLRTPLKLLDHGTRLSQVETELASQAVNVKKALRRAGIAEKKANPPPTLGDLSAMPAELPEDVDPLDHASRLARIRGLRNNGRRAR